MVERNLDAMAAVKLNVFHWHLSDDQGFRVESKLYPKLQEMGSDGHYYTQDEMREVVAYARDRGIRVVPEFDIPGHTLSWLAGYPELTNMPGPFTIGRTWGVFDPVMDPTSESTYQFLDGFIGEMVQIFPGPVLPHRRRRGQRQGVERIAAHPGLRQSAQSRRSAGASRRTSTSASSRSSISTARP